MRSARKATRQNAGGEISQRDLPRVLQEVVRRKPISRQQTHLLLRRFFTADGAVEATSKRISLICPISKRRIKHAVRGLSCKHVECFDLHSYLEYHTQMTFWECPFTFCKEHVHCDQLRLDEFFNDIICGVSESVLDVDVRQDGSFAAVEAPVIEAFSVNDYADDIDVSDLKPNKQEPAEGTVMATSFAPGQFEVEGALLQCVQDDRKTADEQGDSHMDIENLSAESHSNFRCAHCNAVFRKRQYLRCHMRIHTGERPFKCEYCGKSFRVAIILTRHRRTHTGEKPYECDICKKRFAQRDHLSTHRRTHTNERPYACRICGKSFAQSHNRQVHEATQHFGERKFHCTDCGAAFKTSQALRCHIVMHTAERNHHCDICGKTFQHKGNLKTHKRIHTQQRDYECKTCGKRFIQLSALNAHVRIHTGEKPFGCDFCDARFKSSAHLQSHQAVHSDDRTHQCGVCDKTFKRSGDLRRHLRQHH